MINRRKILGVLTGLGIGTAFFRRALASSIVQGKDVNEKMIADAEWIAGLELTEEERSDTLRVLKRDLAGLQKLKELNLKNSDIPAVVFRPFDNRTLKRSEKSKVEVDFSAVSGKPAIPKTDEDFAFLPVNQLAKLIESGTVKSIDLTKIYLERLKKYNPLLNCVVNLTEELALKQAKQADQEIKAGKYRGPLHGIPWGAKDLIAVPGYPTTWGAPQYKDQKIDEPATVYQRLTDAGAVLVAKLSLGALAMGDDWFGGRTRCPWNYKVGSSGSSAGSASATAAGLVGFSIGSETMGSILSPSRRCGVSGLRPTFGRVSRHGCMSLSWTLDKIGPITRSAKDCAIVFSAICGKDPADPTTEDADFFWPSGKNLQDLVVGYTASRTPLEDRPDIAILKQLGVKLKEIELPFTQYVRGISSVLDMESAAAFEDLTTSGNVDGLNAWPRIFRAASFINGIDYLRAMRARTILQKEFESLMQTVDILINANDLMHTNLTGHPSIAIPVGFRKRQSGSMPFSTILTGRLNDESTLLQIADAYQQKVDSHLQRPPLDQQMKAKANEQKEKQNEPK